MKLAFAYEQAYPWFNGGIEKRRFLIMRELAKHGHEVHFFTMYRKGMPGKEFQREKIKYHCVCDAPRSDLMYIQGRRGIGWSMKYSTYLFLGMFMHKGRFDIIDTDAFPFLHIMPLKAYANMSRSKLVITWHEVWSKDYWKEYLGSKGNIGYFCERLSAKATKYHIANSSTTKELLQKEFGVSEKDIILFPAAIDENEINSFLRTNKRKQQNKFVAIGRLVSHKRIGLAISSMKDVDAELVVIGAGPEKSALEKLAEKNKRKVIFKENINAKEFMQEVCTSKALLMLSAREGLSLTTVEALALGTPVVIADSTSLPNELRKYCIEAQEHMLPKLLQQIANSKLYDKYKRDAIQNRKKVMKEFSASGAAELYERLNRMQIHQRIVKI